MQIRLNDQKGMKKAALHTVGDVELSINTLSVAESREAYVKLQPFFRGFMMAEEMNGALGGIQMASLAGALSEEQLKFLMELFAKKSSYMKVERADSGREVEMPITLNQPGQMDALFGGEWDAVLEWLEVCIHLNFGKQIAKLYGALAAGGQKLDTSASDPAPKAKPTSL